MGPHRTGTTLLVRLLKKFGFFAGARVKNTEEALVFQRANEWLLRRAGGSWDNPGPARSFYGGGEDTEALDTLFCIVRSRGFAEFTGSFKDLLMNTRTMRGAAWGWKDPRNVFTAGLWLRVFPGAKVVYINRNGVDAAASLLEREARQQSAASGPARGIWPVVSRLASPVPVLSADSYRSSRCGSLMECFGLWEEYTDEAGRFLEGFRGQSISVRYEDLLSDPESRLREITSFCGLEAGTEELRTAASIVKPERAYAFAGDGRLARFYEEVRLTRHMRALGYQDVARLA